MKSKGLKYAPMMVFQIILMVLYFVFVEYETTPGAPGGNIQGFGDTHVMIFIGFGFLMTFLKKYCYSALGFNLLLAALVIQWGLLCQNAFHMSGGKIIVTKTLLLEADVMAATVLITFGALLGYTSDLQLLFIAIVETAVGCVNFWIVADKIQAADVGGSIAIHAYGAYFGLGVSLALKRRAAQAQDGQVAADNGQAHSLNAPTYVSDVTAMIGSIFLWIYWPSFNSALTESVLEHQRAVVNTYLSLASATVTSFFLSVALTHEHKLDMVHIQNSPLAGGVGVGSICNMFIGAGGAIAVGIGAGIISVFGYVYLTVAYQNCPSSILLNQKKSIATSAAGSCQLNRINPENVETRKYSCQFLQKLANYNYRNLVSRELLMCLFVLKPQLEVFILLYIIFSVDVIFL